MQKCRADLLERLLSLARLRVPPEEYDILCRDIDRISSYLRRVGKLVEGLEVAPLYHVWEEEGALKDRGLDRRVNIEDLAPDMVEGRWIRVPWRGSRVEEDPRGI